MAAQCRIERYDTKRFTVVVQRISPKANKIMDFQGTVEQASSSSHGGVGRLILRPSAMSIPAKPRRTKLDAATEWGASWPKRALGVAAGVRHPLPVLASGSSPRCFALR